MKQLSVRVVICAVVTATTLTGQSVDIRLPDESEGIGGIAYGAAHFFRNMPAAYLATMGQDVGLTRALETTYPGRTLVVIPLGGRLDLPPAIKLRILPDYQKFDRALKAQTRPVLVPLSREPFGGFSSRNLSADA